MLHRRERIKIITHIHKHLFFSIDLPNWSKLYAWIFLSLVINKDRNLSSWNGMREGKIALGIDGLVCDK